MSVEQLLADAVGIVGVGLLLAAYFLLQRGTLGAHSIMYLAMNMSASVCILLSLVYTPNIPSIIIQLCWIAISLYGILRSMRKAEHDTPSPTSKDQEPESR